MSRLYVHVVPASGGWIVHFPERKTDARHFASKDEALAHATRVALHLYAMGTPSGVRVYQPDGTPDRDTTYGTY
ncbi:MAG TPA: DUF2188 domain-containing protein [Lysobacter sp.]|nr:DUF2188 domain-containing protein [Lysobacter sp.]